MAKPATLLRLSGGPAFAAVAHECLPCATTANLCGPRLLGLERMAQTIVIIALALSVALALLLYLGVPSLLQAHWGKLALLAGAVVLPLVTTAGTVAVGVQESSRTRFCLSCHEMQNHGKSLFVDNPRALAAAHYQNRLIDRDTVCYSCHKDYALFGDVKAKLNGLRHVYVHYLSTPPTKLELYQPYPNSNCLHCHADARRFIEAAPHAAAMDHLISNKTSCLSCHNVAHDMENVAASRFWQAEAALPNAAKPSEGHGHE